MELGGGSTGVIGTGELTPRWAMPVFEKSKDGLIWYFAYLGKEGDCWNEYSNLTGAGV